MRRAGVPDRSGELYRRLARHAVTFARGTFVPIRIGPALRAAIDSTRGAPKVIWASHTGNWEAALAGMAEHLPLCAIVKQQSSPWADRLATRRRTRAGVLLLAPTGSLVRAGLALRAHMTVVSLGDQAPTRRRGSVQDTFLGAGCFSDPSAALLAARARCPLWVVAQHVEGEVTVVELLGVETVRGLADVARATRAATARLDAHVREHPADWLWLHRRWKTPA